MSTPTNHDAPPQAPAKRRRVPAEERREDVLRVAAAIVARDGMHAASTAEIAKGSGISHAYLFRLFPTKEELMLEVSHRAGDAMHQGMIAAGEQAKARGEDPLVAMGIEWTNQLADHTNLLVSLQSITASRSLPVLGDRLREAWGEVIADIARISGAGPDAVRAFVAQGMLLQVIAALGAEDAEWVSWLHDGPLPCMPPT
ncbi:MAG: TetR/AcrR family transcriptional regulator [Patulibacter minatonensis]